MNASPLQLQCAACGQVHRGLPAWHFPAPLQAAAIPDRERGSRLELTADDCIIDQREFYLKGLLELPVHGSTDSFVWGIWLSVSPESHASFVRLLAIPCGPLAESSSGGCAVKSPDIRARNSSKQDSASASIQCDHAWSSSRQITRSRLTNAAVLIQSAPLR